MTIAETSQRILDAREKTSKEMENLQARQKHQREEELAKLLRAYRVSQKAKQETEAFFAALEKTMMRLAKWTIRRKKWAGVRDEEIEDLAERIVLRVIDEKWSSGCCLLDKWDENGGATITTWLSNLIRNEMVNIWREEKPYDNPHHPSRVSPSENAAETEVQNNIASQAKSQESWLRTEEFNRLFKDIIKPGDTFHKPGKNGKPPKLITLHDNHILTYRTMLNLCIKEMRKDDEDASNGKKNRIRTFLKCTGRRELARTMVVNPSKAEDWKDDVIAFLKQHPQRNELIELMTPFGDRTDSNVPILPNPENLYQRNQRNQRKIKNIKKGITVGKVVPIYDDKTGKTRELAIQEKHVLIMQTWQKLAAGSSTNPCSNRRVAKDLNCPEESLENWVEDLQQYIKQHHPDDFDGLMKLMIPESLPPLPAGEGWGEGVLNDALCASAWYTWFKPRKRQTSAAGHNAKPG